MSASKPGIRGGKEPAMKVLLATCLVGCAAIAAAGCSSGNPPGTDQKVAQEATQTKQIMGAKAGGGMAPGPMAAPPGMANGDQRGGLSGGTMPGLSRK